MKRNKIISKRILPILLTFAMLLTAVPAMSLSGIFAATYTDPQVGDVAQVRTSSYALKNGKVSESGLSSAPSNAYMAVDKDGVRHTIRNVHFRDTGIAASYNPNLQMFCIEFGAPYPGTSAGFDYEGYSLSTSEYWKSLTKAQKEGVLLIIGFGYPASSYSDLGVSGPGHALAATQILIWEFATGRRTTYTGSAKETDLYDSAIEGEGAETAYWNILKKANEARSSGAYSYEKMLKEAAYVVWEKESYQTMMTWSLIGTTVQPREENGAIEVYKKNPNGKNLSGAEFTIYRSDGTVYEKITTNANGYAVTDGGTEDPQIPFGTYIVKETKAPAGYKLSAQTWTVTVSASKSTVTINAVNESQTASVTLSPIKLVNGQAPGNVQYTFKLKDSTGKVIDTQVNNSYGNVFFRNLDALTFDADDVGKTFKFTITEDVSNPKPGVTYDTHTLSVSITPKLVNGVLTATPVYTGSTTFSNTYDASGSWTPIVYKELIGKTLKAGQFRFELIDENGVVRKSKSNLADGKVEFTPFTYDLDDIGTHTYKIREVIEDEDGITYDTHVVTFTVKVSDVGNGTLKIEESHTGSTTFSNKYEATGTWSPVVYKELIGKELTAGQFKFELIDENGVVRKSKSNLADGKVEFTPFTYDLDDVGTHVYKVREVIGDEEGITYDTHVVTYTVKVSDAGDGTLNVDASRSGSETFVNTYDADATWSPVVYKELIGKTLKAGMFKFELYDENGVVLKSKTNDANGKVEFTSIKYDLDDIGTHVYKVREVIGDEAGITYDTHVVTYTVKVSDAGDGTLKLNVSRSGSETFVNTYDASGSWSPVIYKELVGKALVAGQFTFILSEDGSQLKSKTNSADGKVEFIPIEYTLADIGTHVYTVEEVIGNEEGITYDTHVVTYTVKVSDAGDGTLKVEESHTGSTTFVNTYSADAVWNPTVTKKLVGKTLKAGMFRFELTDENGVVLKSKTNDADGKVEFTTFKYDLDDVGTHVYTIREVIGEEKGMTYDDHVVTYTVVVSDNSDGTLRVRTSRSGSATFVNTYEATGSWQPVVYKQLVGKKLTAGMFSFVLLEDGRQIKSKSNAADGTVAFNAIEYDVNDVGTHVYTVAEKVGDMAGVTYDTHIVTYTVKVSDNSDGTLKVDASRSGSETFINTYEAFGSWQPVVYKQLTGKELTVGQFKFELCNANGSVLKSKTNAADGKVAFNALTYDIDDLGTHVYTIREVIGDAPGYTYDDHVITVRAIVTDNGDGSLNVDVSYEGETTFRNTYEAFGEFEATVTKQLIGRDLTAGQFTFNLFDANGSVIATAQNDADGLVTFEKVKYSLSDLGTHVYTIREVNDGKSGYTYDDHVVTVTAVVTDNGDGSLNVDVTYEGNTVFENTYKAFGTAKVEVHKNLIGRELAADQFSFELVDANGNVIGTAKNDADGNVIFGEIEYDETTLGQFTYTVREVNDGKPGYIYATNEVTVNISVSDNGDGSLKIEVSYPDGDLFENSYEAFGEFEATVTKKLNGRDLVAGQFSFELLDASGNVIATAQNDADGLVTFDAVKYTLADLGTHVYTIREVIGDAPGYVYDDHVVTVRAIVTDNGDGSLNVDVSYEGNTVFENEYVSFGSANVAVIKQFENAVLKGNDFTFELLDANGNVIDSAKNDADGLVSFGQLDYTLADVGVHNYTVREVSGTLPGVTYTDKVLRVVITVSDNSDGTLNVAIEYPDGNVFTNVYSASGSANVSVIKQFENAVLKGNDFTFELLDESGNVIDSAMNDVNGLVSFGQFDYILTDVGVHNYTVREVSGTLPGVTYTDKVLRVVVTVTDNLDGTLNTAIEYPDGNVFTNVYSASGSANVSVIKQFENAVLKGEDFTFELVDADGNVIDSAKNDADGLVTFGQLAYTLADVGVHNYTVREVSGTLPGVTYTDKVLRVVVTVTDNSDGTLNAAIEYPDGNVFTNVYSASGSAQIEIDKSLIGKELQAGMFTFELLEGNTVLDSATNGADGKVIFSSLNYTLADLGEHIYTVREVAGNAGGITYTDKALTVVVSVTDNLDGTLSADVAYPDGKTLINTYEAVGSYTPTVNKVLTGIELVEGQFEFVLTDADGNVIDRATNAADGKVTFGTIPYTLADVGVKTYKIYEVAGDEPGYTYDNHILTITVTIVDRGDGSLSVNGEFDGSTTFVNNYGSTGSFVPTVYKKLIGKELVAGMFKFVLLDMDGNVLQTATNDEFGIVTFAPIEYDEETQGAYMYTIREVNEGKDGYTYDDHVVEVLVLAVDNGDGTMSVSETYNGETTFVNVYEATGSTEVKIYKSLLGAKLKAGQFKFELIDKEGKVIGTALNDADGNVIFSEIEYDETMLGTHYYTVKEVTGELGGVIYTDKILSVVVSVADNGDGSLNVEAAYPTGKTLINNYVADGKGSIEIVKEFENGELTEGQFEFELVDEDGNVVDRAFNDENGVVSFSEIEYTLEQIGTYHFTVREIKGDLENVIYTDKVLRVVVSVTDAGDGNLNVEVSYPDGKTLVNVYEKPEEPVIPDEPDVPQTEDATYVFASVGLIALIGGAALIFSRKRKEENN